MLILSSVWTALRGGWAMLQKPAIRKLILAALAVTGAVLLYASYVSARKDAVDLSRALATTQAELVLVKKEQTALSAAILTRNQLLEAISTEEADERVETIKAIKANPDWANEPIPADVLRSLRK